MTRTRSRYVLSSGRVLHPNSGVLGLMPDYFGDHFERDALTYGYDNMAASDPHPAMVEFEPDAYDPLTAEERREIGEYMAERWQKWGNVTVSSPAATTWPRNL